MKESKNDNSNNALVGTPLAALALKISEKATSPRWIFTRANSIARNKSIPIIAIKAPKNKHLGSEAVRLAVKISAELL